MAPLSCLFLCVKVPFGPAVCLFDIFIRKATITPQPDGMVSACWALTLSLAILSQKSCQGKCAVKLSFLSHPPVSPCAPHHSSLLGQIYFRSYNPLQSQVTVSLIYLFIYLFSSVDTYYSYARFAPYYHILCLLGCSAQRVQLLSKLCRC